MNNISNIHNCYGCGVCAMACGKKIIRIELNKNGFYEPIITDLSACTNCGMCVETCAFSHSEIFNKTSYPINSYGAWSKDARIQNECSSGGVGFEIGKVALSEGYKVCAVRYNAEVRRAEHYLASTVEELEPSKGSKYIQSYSPNGFLGINRKEKNLVFGAPCQIDSLRRYIRKTKTEDNFILVDFFCHGVPSLFSWYKYLDAVEVENGKTIDAVWRNKETGWHDSWAMKIKGEKSDFISWWSKGDVFYQLFLGDYCTNKACRKDCKYKYDRSSADIRIGDLWGKEYASNDKGVSALVAFTEKGLEMITALQKTCILEPNPFTVVAEGQMKKNAGKIWTSPIAMCMLRGKKDFSLSTWKKLIQISRFPRIIMLKCKGLKKRIFR